MSNLEKLNLVRKLRILAEQIARASRTTVQFDSEEQFLAMLDLRPEMLPARETTRQQLRRYR